MTKRWSSTASLDGKTKRQASKDARLDIKRETLDLEGAKSMGTKNNPGEFDCYANAELDEPMFILLARDRAAPDAILRWIECREDLIRRGVKPASDRNMLAEARQCAAAMIEWRTKHRPRAAQV